MTETLSDSKRENFVIKKGDRQSSSLTLNGTRTVETALHAFDECLEHEGEPGQK